MSCFVNRSQRSFDALKQIPPSPVKENPFPSSCQANLKQSLVMSPVSQERRGNQAFWRDKTIFYTFHNGQHKAMYECEKENYQTRQQQQKKAWNRNTFQGCFKRNAGLNLGMGI